MWSKFHVNVSSIDDLAVLCSKGPPARKPPFFNKVTETTIYYDDEEHAFAAAKQSRLYKIFNDTQTASTGGYYEEAGRQKTCSCGPDHGTRRSLPLQLKDDLTDRSCLLGQDV